MPPVYEVRGNIGLIAIGEDGTRLAVGFLIPTFVNFCLWEYVQTGKKGLSFTRAKAVKFITEAAIELATKWGFKAMLGFTPASNKALLKMYDRMGAEKDSVDYRLIIRRI